MTKLIPCQYGESIEVDHWGPDAQVALRCESVEPILDKAQCENLAATIVGMSGVHDGTLSLKCFSDDGSELSPRYSGAGNISMIPTCSDGSVRGEVILTPQDAMALAFELIRMATHE